jgi:hypothetical protein
MRKDTRKKTEKTVEPIIELLPLTQTVHHLDDNEIRELVCRSCQDLMDDYSEEAYPNPLRAMILQSVSEKADVRNALSICDKSRSDLSLYWNTMVQKQILIFEHESFLVMNWNNNIF